MAPAPVLLVRQIHGALLRPRRLIVMIRHWATGRRSAEVRRHHPEHTDPVTQLQRCGHAEPAGAQPRVGFPPVNPGLFLEQLIKLQHLGSRYDIDFELGHDVLQLTQVVEDMTFAIPPHNLAWTPEYEDSVLAGVEQLLPVPEHPLQAGMCHYAYTGAAAHVSLVANAWSVVHTDHTLRLVDYLAFIAAS